LVVYRRYFNFQFDDFITYDRACPLHWEDDCGTLEVVDDIYLECPCTGHQYILFDGSPVAGDSPPLRTYNTDFDGQNVIRITN
jgi:nitrite reductase/ring-hydroxylating ferredoxin subunit